jgi:hypothetical protein
MYQDVVRDIMIRYGEWTTNIDPLSQVVQDYYKAPAWARAKYLEDHPELAAYWAALRTPEEATRWAIQEQYYSITDVMARRAYLQAHPEIKTYLLEARTKRYEKFLNSVAMFMGQNPDLFNVYLQRQTDIMGELLARFGEPPMVGEVPRAAVDNRETGSSPQGEGGRVRNARTA